MHAGIAVRARHRAARQALLLLLLASLSTPHLHAQPANQARPSRLAVDDHFKDRGAWTQRDPDQYNPCKATFADGLVIPMDGDGDQDTNLCEFVRATPVTSSARIETSVSVLKWAAILADSLDETYPGFWIGFGPDASFSFRLSAASAHRPAQAQVFLRTDVVPEPVDDGTPIAATFGTTPTALAVQLRGREATLSVNGVQAARFVADTDLAGAVSLGLHANMVDMAVKFGFVRVYDVEAPAAPRPVAAAAPPAPAPAAAPVAAPSPAATGSEELSAAWRAALPAYLRGLMAQARRGRSLSQSFPGVRLGARRAGSDTIYEVISGPRLPQSSVYLTVSDAGRRHRCYTARPDLHTERAPLEAFQAASSVRRLFRTPWVERQETPSGAAPTLGVYFTSPARRGRPALAVRFVGSQAGGEWYVELQVCRY